MSDARETLRNTVPYLEPVIQERLVQMGQFGNDWADKPVGHLFILHPT